MTSQELSSVTNGLHRGPHSDSEPFQTSRRLAVCVVGAGWRFTSGISYYTCLLANAFADNHDTSVIQMRQLLPRRFYPGRRRVGRPCSSVTYKAEVSVYDGVNWWWGRSLFRALTFMTARQPDVLVLQWWTAAVLHTYIALAVKARLRGTRVILEIHELQDPGEKRFKLVGHYGRWGLRILLRLSKGYVIHSADDQAKLEASYGAGKLRAAVVPHGPFDQYSLIPGSDELANAQVAEVTQAPRPKTVNLLFFGIIRPYKGLEDLLKVFNDLAPEEAASLWLTVVGETWEGCTKPADLIATSPHRSHITFVNEYVSDDVVTAAFRHADVVVLPYRRSSGSGVLHVAMNYGLPIVATSVGGLPEAAAGYAGAIFAPPNDPQALKVAIRRATQLAGQRFEDPRSWADSIRGLLFAAGATHSWGSETSEVLGDLSVKS
jgi:glycosyltransferase involved in cell wall biosynthesis